MAITPVEMAITWTNVIIENTENKTTRNDEFDSQAMHTEDNLDSKTRSVEGSPNRCNSINNASPHEITHSRKYEKRLNILQRRTLNIKNKV